MIVALFKVKRQDSVIQSLKSKTFSGEQEIKGKNHAGDQRLTGGSERNTKSTRR